MSINFIWTVLIRNLQQIRRSRSQLSLVFFFPIGFIAVFAFMFMGSSGVAGNTTFTIAVVNNDSLDSSWQTTFNSTYVPSEVFTNTFGTYLSNSLQKKTSLSISTTTFTVLQLSESVAIEKVKSRVAIAALIIPSNFSYAMLSGINYKVNLTQGNPLSSSLVVSLANATLVIKGDIMNQDYQDVYTELTNAIDAFKNHFYGNEANNRFIMTISDIASVELTGFDYFLSGFLTFGLLLGASGTAYVVGRERSLGTLARLRISKSKPSDYIIGVTLGQIIFLAIQVLVMMVSMYFFGFRGQGNPLYAFVVVLLTIIPVLGLGMLIAALDTTGQNGSGVVAILSAPLGFLSGAFIPLPDVILIPNFVPQGDGFRALQLWDFFPFTSSINALRKILLNKYDLFEVLPELFFLITCGVLFFGIALAVFAKKVFKPTE